MHVTEEKLSNKVFLFSTDLAAEGILGVVCLKNQAKKPEVNIIFKFVV